MKTISSRYGMTYHSLCDADHEELAAAVHLRGRPKGGIAFAQKMASHSNPEKSSARAAVFVHYRDRIWPGPLRILTLPGLKWPFERMLTKARACYAGSTTEIYAVESDAAIFKASLHWIPGRDRRIEVVDSDVVRTPQVAWYELAQVEEFISRCALPDFDAAWLDFNGVLNDRKIEAIYSFWQISLRHSLTVTSMVARAPEANEGKIVGTLLDLLPHSELVYSRRYVEKVPMHQVMVKRKGEDVWHS